MGALHQKARRKSSSQESPAKKPEAELGAQPSAADDAEVGGSEQQAEGGRLSYPPPASPKKKGFFGFGKAKDTQPPAEGATETASANATPEKKSWLSWASPTKQSEGQQSAETSPAKRGWFGRTKAGEPTGDPATTPAAADAAQQPPEDGQQQQEEDEETRDTEQARQQPLPPSYPPPGSGAPGAEGEGQEPDGASGADGAQPAAKKGGLLGGLFGKKSSTPDKSAQAEAEVQGAEQGAPPKGSPVKKLFGLGSAPPKDPKDAAGEASSQRGIFGFMRGKKPQDPSGGEGEALPVDTMELCMALVVNPSSPFYW